MKNNTREFLEKYYLIPLFAVYAVTRLPFIGLGFGADFDAWRVAAAAKEMAAHWTYAVSRFPGYPLFEIINAFLINAGGWWLSNSATGLVFAGSIFVFDAVLRELKSPGRILSVLLYSFFPLFWKNSVCTMDYLWALFFILLAFLLLLKNRYVLSALFLGISAGFRLTGVIFIIPFLLYLFLNHKYRQALLFIAVTSVSGIISYSPAIVVYGTSAFSYFSPAHFEWMHILYYAVYAAGIIPSCLLVISLISGSGKIISEIKARKPVPIVCITAIFSVLAVFCFLPHEREYLIPLFPFAFILIAAYSRKLLFIAFAAVSILYAVVMIELKDTASIDRIVLKPHIDAGLVVRDFREREGQLGTRKTLASFLRARYGTEKKLLVVTGWKIGIPQILDNPDFAEAGIFPEKSENVNIYRLKDTEIRVLAGPVDELRYNKFREAGYEFAFVEGAIRYGLVAYGFSPEETAADVISLAEIK